jgi:hypothetical protein
MRLPRRHQRRADKPAQCYARGADPTLQAATAPYGLGCRENFAEMVREFAGLGFRFPL